MAARWCKLAPNGIYPHPKCITRRLGPSPARAGRAHHLTVHTLCVHAFFVRGCFHRISFPHPQPFSRREKGAGNARVALLPFSPRAKGTGDEGNVSFSTLVRRR